MFFSVIHRAATPLRLSLLTMAVLSGVCGSASAAGTRLPVSSGQLGNQLRQDGVNVPQAPAVPSLSLPSDEQGTARAPESAARVTVKQVRFTGDSVSGVRGVTDSALQKVISPWLDRPLSFGDLQGMTDAVTQYYRDHGVLLARAILPPQTIKDGQLEVRVVPGRYDTASMTNSSPLRDVQAVRMVEAAAPSGQVVTKGSLERMALLLAEVPGVEAQVALKAGSQPGTTAPEVTLTPGKRTGGYVGLDNQGDPTTGRSRVMAGVYANGLLGYGDQLRVDLLDAYEKSNLINGSLDYSLLAGGYGTRVGMNYSHLNYRYSLGGLGFKGYSDNQGLYVTHPWIRTARARVDVRLDAGQQFLTDVYPDALGGKGRKRVSTGSLGLSGSVAALPGGLTGFSLTGTTGDVSLRNGTARYWSRNDGRFALLGYQFSHDQQVWGPFSVYGGVRGQMSDHNLDPSQKFLLGGPSAVRAYDIGDGSVDQGMTGTAEVRFRRDIPAQFRMGNSPQLTVAAFYDQGLGEQYRDNNDGRGGHLGDHNRLDLAGAGLYTSVADAGSYAVTLTWAHRTGNADPNAVHHDHDRFWVTAVKLF